MAYEEPNVFVIYKREKVPFGKFHDKTNCIISITVTYHQWLNKSGSYLSEKELRPRAICL